MTDYWLSRRPKYTVEETFGIGLDYVLDDGFYQALGPLKLAASRGHEEAAWLIGQFDIPSSSIDNIDRNAPIRSMCFIGDDTPRSDRYLWWFASRSGSIDVEYPSILSCAEAGDAICQHIIGERYEDEVDYDSSAIWYAKAASQNFARSAHRLSLLFKIGVTERGADKQESKRFLHQAANLNYAPAIRELYSDLDQTGDTSVEISINAAVLDARAYIMDSWGSLSPLKKKLDTAKLNFNNPETRNDAIRLYYMVGREFEGYDYYHMRLEGTIGGDVSVPTAKFYRQMTSKTRQASVQTILALRSIGICRDVAVLIAKLVYASRMDAEWYVDNQ